MKYLFIGAHCDDLELCCGGTISKIVEQGHEVSSLTLSYYYNKQLLIDELEAAQHKLGVSKILLEPFEVRNFAKYRQPILQKIVDSGNYDYVFTHSANDLHQDHKIVGDESLRVFKKTNLITYTGEWNQLNSESNYYIDLTDAHMAKKYEAMQCYQSQLQRPYFDKQFTYSRALLNGAKIGVKYAEAFRILNMKG
jgi:LmbE family N-acetylglucosaminyl deacetylase